MSRALPLFVLLGLVGVSTGLSAAGAAETTPELSDSSPEGPSSTSPAGSPALRGTPTPKHGKPARKPDESAKETKEKDKAKAAQSGNDAKLRDLPSPAQKGSE